MSQLEEEGSEGTQGGIEQEERMHTREKEREGGEEGETTGVRDMEDLQGHNFRKETNFRIRITEFA